MAKLKTATKKPTRVSAKKPTRKPAKKPMKKASMKAKVKPATKAKATPKRKTKAKPKGDIRPLPIQDMEAFGSFVLDCVMLTLLETHNGEYEPDGRPKIDHTHAAKVIGEATEVLGMMLGFFHAHLHHDLGMENTSPAAFGKEVFQAWLRGWQERCKGCGALAASLTEAMPTGPSVGGIGGIGGIEGIRMVKIPDHMRGAVEALITKIVGANVPHAHSDDDPDPVKKPN